MRPLILISNDDSIYSKGIKELIEVAKQFGKVIVVAPDKPQSAKSHSVTLDAPITINKITRFGDVEAYKCSGTPADCVKMAIYQVLDRKPDLVLSGINHGANYSVNLIYSGTVAVATEALMHSIPSIAFSVTTHDSDADFTLAKKYIHEIIEKIIKAGLNPKTCLNVNIPDIELEKAQGIKICTQTKGVWSEEFIKREHPTINKSYYWLTGEFSNLEPDNKKTDVWAINNNYIAIVPLQIDFTNYPMLEDLKKIF